MSRRLRHVKTVVQHVFVIDDGDTLDEVSTDPVVVSAAHWPTYPTQGFAESVAALAASLSQHADATERP